MTYQDTDAFDKIQDRAIRYQQTKDKCRALDNIIEVSDFEPDICIRGYSRASSSPKVSAKFRLEDEDALELFAALKEAGMKVNAYWPDNNPPVVYMEWEADR
jgi:hypothetical protein